jgi:hypothetical protein
MYERGVESGTLRGRLSSARQSPGPETALWEDSLLSRRQHPFTHAAPQAPVVAYWRHLGRHLRPLDWASATFSSQVVTVIYGTNLFARPLFAQSMFSSRCPLLSMSAA